MTNDMIMKFDFFMNKGLVVHITKKDNEFLNGILVEQEQPGIYVIKEKKFGLMHIFVSDVDSIEEFREVKE